VKTILLLLFSLFAIQLAHGQDKIFTRDGNLLNVNIVNDSEKAFNYVTNNSDTVSILTIYKNRISRIEYANGTINMMGYQNPRKNRPLGINIGYGFSKTETYTHHFDTYTEQEITMLTSGIDYFIIPQIDLQATVGTSGGQISYFSAGFDIHLNSNNSKTGITPFAGIAGGAIVLNNYTSGTGFGQVHLGLNYLSGFGLNFAVMENFLLNNTNHLPFFTEIRIGWKFKL
jgi:hypothetical protein